MYRFNWCILLWFMARSYNGHAKELTEIETLSTKSKFCSYEKAFDMSGAYCEGLGLTKIPSLRGGIEILVFSKNRLRNINSDTLSSYTSLKFLYLSENYIRHIDENALSSLTDLQSLDLSVNALTMLPDSLFQLPSLRKLYLSGNDLSKLSSEYFLLTKPIKAPLDYLDLSDCILPKLPDFGHLPELLVYNVSLNPLRSIDAKQFARMCSLTKIDLSGTLATMKLCELRPAVTWFQEKHVTMTLDDYSKLNSREFDECPEVDVSTTLNATYLHCKSQFLGVQNRKSAKRSTIKIVGGLVGFLIGFILLLYLTHRWNVSRSKKIEKKLPPTIGDDKQAAAILLRDVS